MFPDRRDYSTDLINRDNQHEEQDEATNYSLDVATSSSNGYSSYSSGHNAATNGINNDHSYGSTYQGNTRNGHQHLGSNGQPASSLNPSHAEARSGIVTTHESTVHNLEEMERSLTQNGVGAGSSSIRDVITKFQQQHEDNIHLLDFLHEEEERSLEEEEEDDYMFNSQAA